MDTSGNWIWVRQAGGSDNDLGYGIAIDNNGNSYVTGYFEDTAAFGSNFITSSGSSDIFVAKMDTNGTWIWAHNAGGSSDDYGIGVAEGDNGTSYVTGLEIQ